MGSAACRNGGLTRGRIRNTLSVKCLRRLGGTLHCAAAQYLVVLRKMRRTVGLCQPPEVEAALHKAARRLYGEQQQESEQQRAQTATSKPPPTFRMCSNRVRAPRASTMAVTGNISRYDAPAAPAPPAAVSPPMHTVCLHLHLHC